MYGLPADFDASVFVGRELEQVCFSVNTIRFDFDGDIAITATSSIVLTLSAGTEPEQQAPPVVASRVMALVGRKVRSAQSHTDGTLRLCFEGGGSLTYRDDMKSYESYYIRIADKEIVV